MKEGVEPEYTVNLSLDEMMERITLLLALPLPSWKMVGVPEMEVGLNQRQMARPEAASRAPILMVGNV